MLLHCCEGGLELARGACEVGRESSRLDSFVSTGWQPRPGLGIRSAQECDECPQVVLVFGHPPHDWTVAVRGSLGASSRQVRVRAGSGGGSFVGVVESELVGDHCDVLAVAINPVILGALPRLLRRNNGVAPNVHLLAGAHGAHATRGLAAEVSRTTVIDPTGVTGCPIGNVLLAGFYTRWLEAVASRTITVSIASAA